MEIFYGKMSLLMWLMNLETQGSIICEPGNLAENGEENHYKTYLMKKKIN